LDHVWISGDRGAEAEQSIVMRSGHIARWFAPSEVSMPHFVGLDVSRKTIGVAITLLKDGDHRLSTHSDLALLAQTLGTLIMKVESFASIH
jgi:hypothetical protein